MVWSLLGSFSCVVRAFVVFAWLLPCALTLITCRPHHKLDNPYLLSEIVRCRQYPASFSHRSSFWSPLLAAQTPSSLRMTSFTSASRKFRKALLEIEIPSSPDSSDKVLRTLTNDEYIANMVKETYSELYIYIWADVSCPSGAISAYLSEIYSQLWDEMIISSNIELECFVSSNGFEHTLFDLEKLCTQKDLDVIMSSRVSSSSRIKTLREVAGVGDVEVRMLPSLSGMFLPSSDPALYTNIHFLDDNLAAVPKYSKIAVGGTFDRIHNGHKKLLTLAACVATECLIVGVTSDEMLAAKANAKKIADSATRAKGVIEFLEKACKCSNAQVVTITNPYGPTIDDASIDALIVSSETMKGALKINEIRKEKGFSPLNILVSRRSNAATLSSTFIRNLEA